VQAELVMRRYALRDDQWDRIRNLLPGREGWVGVTAADNRLFIEAVLYCYRAGIAAVHGGQVGSGGDRYFDGGDQGDADKAGHVPSQ